MARKSKAEIIEILIQKKIAFDTEAKYDDLAALLKSLPDEDPDDRKNLRNEDIPDLNKKDAKKKTVLSPEKAAESMVRWYIRKDGFFRKDLASLFDRATGKRDEDGNMIYTPVKTVAQAETYATAVCNKSGRKVETVDGRKRAVPGWDLSIRIAGMASSETKAVTAPQGAAKQELADRALLYLQDENAQLQATVKELVESIKTLQKK